MSNEGKSWYGLYEFRKKIRKDFPNFWRVKIIKKPSDAVSPFLYKGVRILDVGSGNRNLEKKLKSVRPDIIYKSMDIDRNRFHDYYSLDDIKETFDLVLLFEVIEHLELEDAVSMLKKIKDILVPGGRFILTTPNVYHPNRYWEYSHKVAYRYDELGGLLMSLGYKMGNIYRVYNAPVIQRFIRLYIMAPLHSYLSIDFARSIIIVAENSVGQNL